MTETQTEILSAATFINQYESGRLPKISTNDPALYQIAASALRYIIQERIELEFVRGISNSHPAIQGMIADVIWDSRISRDRALHCPELDDLMNKLTASQ